MSVRNCIRQKMAAAAKGAPPAMLTDKQGAAHALVVCAASFASERQGQFGLGEYLEPGVRFVRGARQGDGPRMPRHHA